MARKQVRKARTTPAGREEREAPEGRQEVREDVRRLWWPEA